MRRIEIADRFGNASARDVAALSLWMLLALALVIGAAVPASAQWNLKSAYCNEDGVTATPSFGTRDSNKCLNVNPGNGDAMVPIQREIFGEKMVPGDCGDVAGYTRMRNKPAWSHPDCENGCASVLVWNSTLDGYASNACRAEDGIFVGQDYGLEIFWIKDSTLANFWKCDKSNAWKGPNGVSCPSGGDDGAHVDGIQMLNTPQSDGWFIIQDSHFYNGYNLHGLWQASSPTLGSILLQGMDFGRKESILNAKQWITDCMTGFAANNSNKSDICGRGKIRIDAAYREVWIVDSWSPSGTSIVVNPDIGKVVVVNTGCSKSGCGGQAASFNGDGWPHPLSAPGEGPGSCPNGKIKSSSPPIYCYTSVERAKAAHKLPPFVHLSAAGWDTPPSGTSPPPPPPPDTTTRPAAPTLLP